MKTYIYFSLDEDLKELATDPVETIKQLLAAFRKTDMDTRAVVMKMSPSEAKRFSEGAKRVKEAYDKGNDDDLGLRELENLVDEKRVGDWFDQEESADEFIEVLEKLLG